MKSRIRTYDAPVKRRALYSCAATNHCTSKLDRGFLNPGLNPRLLSNASLLPSKIWKDEELILKVTSESLVSRSSSSVEDVSFFLTLLATEQGLVTSLTEKLESI